jgi:hypothetical protein
VLAALITFAATEGEESSKTVFYVCGGLLAAWALFVSAIGIKRHAIWPATDGAKRAVMGVSVLLIVAAMASAVLTA